MHCNCWNRPCEYCSLCLQYMSFIKNRKKQKQVGYFETWTSVASDQYWKMRTTSKSQLSISTTSLIKPLLFQSPTLTSGASGFDAFVYSRWFGGPSYIHFMGMVYSLIHSFIYDVHAIINPNTLASRGFGWGGGRRPK